MNNQLNSQSWMMPTDNDEASKKGSRSVIPSKRAAQNRAAQKAFRQRREQYIKDLETRAKEWDDWQREFDCLKKENKELLHKITSLENQITILTNGDQSKLNELEENSKQRSMSLSTSINETMETTISNEVVTETPNNEPIKENKESIPTNDTMNKPVIQEDQVQQSIELQYPNNSNNAYNIPMPDFDVEFDFDPFFEDEFGPTITNNNDFLPNENSNQVLDDLFAMLQTRQRPQIPMIPTKDKQNIT